MRGAEEATPPPLFYGKHRVDQGPEAAAPTPRPAGPACRRHGRMPRPTRRLRRGGSGTRHPAGHPCARVRRARVRQLPNRRWRGHRGAGRMRGAGRALFRGPARSHSRHPSAAVDDGRCRRRHPAFAGRGGRRFPGSVHARGVAGRRRDPRCGFARALLRGRHALAARNRGWRRNRPRDDPGAGSRTGPVSPGAGSCSIPRGTTSRPSSSGS